jgi:membrane fusion protein (multidrug efflux system)
MNPNGELRPGQFARVRIELPPVPGVIALPQTSVVTSLYGDYVYVVEPASAEGAAAPTAEAPAGNAPAQGDGEAAAAPTPSTEAPAGATETPVPPAQAASAAEPAEAQSEADPAPASADPNAPPQLVARQVFVQLGRRQGGMVEIVKGLDGGQRVVTSGQNKLANNTPVVINNDVDPAALALENGSGRS